MVKRVMMAVQMRLYVYGCVSMGGCRPNEIVGVV
jgi:hypothetical protein